MPTLKSFSLAVVIGFTGAGPDGIATGGPQTPDGVGRISGWTRSPTFEAVAGVQVSLACPPLRLQTVVSDAAGRFEFQSPQGNCRIIARKEGYVETSFNGPPSGSGYGLDVRPGSSHDGIELLLEEGAVISGVIAGPGGAPADGIRFQLVRRQITNGIVTLVPLAYAPVREGGRYRTGAVPPGDYYVRASAPPAGSSDAVFNVAPTYFPGTADVGAATVITVRAGEVRTANFPLVAAATFTVTGVVRDAAGNAVADASISISADGSLAWITGTGRTGSDGRFSIAGLPDGRYVLRAFKAATAGQPSQHGDMHFDVNGGDVDLVLVRTAPR